MFAAGAAHAEVLPSLQQVTEAEAVSIPQKSAHKEDPLAFMPLQVVLSLA